MPLYGTVNSPTLNLRERASTDSRILVELAKGALVEVIRDAGFGWLQVRVDGTGQDGYVSRIYLNLSDARPSAPATPVPERPPTQDRQEFPWGQRAEVTAPSLNIRSGPGTSFALLMAVPQGSVLNVLEVQGDWIKVKLGTGEGYVSAQYVNLGTTKPATSFLIEQSELLDIGLVPERLIPAQADNTSEAILAGTWNGFGGLVGPLAKLLNIPASSVVAVLAAESGGRTFGPDGRIIIRFEVHLFHRNWGEQNQAVFDRYFAYDTSAPANAWKGHRWRPDENSQWQTVHTDQKQEWTVFEFARKLDDTAALFSTSMGAPQVMGFNFRRLGYDSVQRMFENFTRSAHAQVIAMFDFVKGTGATSEAIQALQNGDFLTFASIYNGPANAQTYGDIIRRYTDIYNRLIATAVPAPRP